MQKLIIMGVLRVHYVPSNSCNLDELHCVMMDTVCFEGYCFKLNQILLGLNKVSCSVCIVAKYALKLKKINDDILGLQVKCSFNDIILLLLLLCRPFIYKKQKMLEADCTKICTRTLLRIVKGQLQTEEITKQKSLPTSNILFANCQY